jgi:hypothetical protein
LNEYLLTRALQIDVIETKNRTLEETAAVFDGVDATEQITAAAAALAGVTHDLGGVDEKSDDVKDEKASTGSAT